MVKIGRRGRAWTRWAATVRSKTFADVYPDLVQHMQFVAQIPSRISGSGPCPSQLSCLGSFFTSLRDRPESDSRQG